MTQAWNALSWHAHGDWEWRSKPFGYYIIEEPSAFGTFYAVKHKNHDIGLANTLQDAREMAECHYNTGAVTPPPQPKKRAKVSDVTNLIVGVDMPF